MAEHRRSDPVYASVARPDRAGFGRRFVAGLLDCLVLFAPLAFVRLVLNGPVWLSALLTGIYFVVLEGRANGQTIGKRVLGIKVVDASTHKPIGIGRAAVRHGSRYWSGILLLGYLWMLWDSERQTWHDKIAQSIVIPVGQNPAELDGHVDRGS